MRLEVGVRVALEDVAHGLAHPGRRVDAVGEAEDLVRADARATSRSPCAPWSCDTALAPWVMRRQRAVMSNWDASFSTPSPRSSSRSTGTPPVFGRPSPSSRGPATRRTRSASKRSLPAATGVWIVNTLLRATVVEGVVERQARGDVARASAPRAGTRSGPR